MPAPQYMTPQYINYDMISTTLSNEIKVDLENDPPIPPNNMYIGQVNDYMAQGESYVIETYLQNYVAIPLRTLAGDDWSGLFLSDEWYSTGANLKSLFIAAAFFYIYEYYFGTSGLGNNGKELIDNAYKQINRQANALLRVDQAGNPLLKNCYVGLQPCPNYTQRIAQSAKVPLIPTGRDQGQMAINSIPNYRWGFNR